MDEDRLAAERDAIYGLPLDEFVEERDRRARALRSEGLRDEAAALEGARKPTVPAWAVDQLARREPDGMRRLLDAGQELRDAQRRAASGRGADGLRSATRAVRDAVSDLRRRAGAILTDNGSTSAAHLEDVERTLFSGAVTPEQHEELRRGILERPLEGPGFGGIEGLVLLAPDDGSAGGPADEARQDELATPEDDDATAEAARREEERRRQRRRRRLQQQAQDLERSHRDQLRRAERAEEEAARLRERADDAARTADDERQEAESIGAELSAVRAELTGLDAERSSA